MTSSPTEPVLAQPAHQEHHQRELLSPREESVRAMEDTRRLLQEALALLDAPERERACVVAYEHAAECADHIAKALWFLHRADVVGAASAGVETHTTTVG